ncbi:hypothetical protein LOTGIDRAFT_230663 [Lottia gigantea]|uniref:Uncharacterized protein n=1 Tax=Lottia gigantea TaxID=225164 RepID=V4ABJ8_LOTGI|nr:hypothetical protein LOTGIDRAFT_230663 [Lottia gigantea]ESP01334.1 hypothetical protein LOTGIDRAFT_230663 [Lottia gigantea]
MAAKWLAICLHGKVESFPSPSLDRYLPSKVDYLEDNCREQPELDKGAPDLSDIAIEVEITSCTRCAKCHCLIYDEEIMSGWSADDSNLNTKCPFCPANVVPNLCIYLKDWRTNKKRTIKEEFVVKCDDDEESEVTSHKSSMSESQLMFDEDGLVEDKNLMYSSPNHLSVTNSSPKRLTESLLSFSEGGRLGVEPVVDSASMNLGEIALDARKRCTSECLTHATDDVSYSSSYESIDGIHHKPKKSPLSISLEKEEKEDYFYSEGSNNKMDIMSRCISTLEPIVVPYLSPLVLRKELEHVLENEGDLCLSSDGFIDDHPIIFWNLQSKGYSSSNVLIQPLWDNTRIHDEVGLPMYIAWDSAKSATMIDALITETQPYSRAVMHQIFTSIQCNDVLTPIKHVMHGRKRLRMRKQRFRSMYREILFLVLKACGRENIDQDAFDREYLKAFDQLHHGEKRHLQTNDRPCTDHVVWCRRVFNELKL